MIVILIKIAFSRTKFSGARFPGQEHVAGNCKIPSVLWYDARGKMVAAGAEAETSTIVSQAEDEGWIKVELYVGLAYLFDSSVNNVS